MVAAALAIAAFGLRGSVSARHGAFAFQKNWQVPSSYVPGTVPPAAYLRINYIGPGVGTYTYLILARPNGSTVVLSNSPAVVSSEASFWAFVHTKISSSSNVTLVAEVFSGGPESGNVQFSRTLTV